VGRRNLLVIVVGAAAPCLAQFFRRLNPGCGPPPAPLTDGTSKTIADGRWLQDYTINEQNTCIEVVKLRATGGETSPIQLRSFNAVTVGISPDHTQLLAVALWNRGRNTSSGVCLWPSGALAV